MTKAVKFKLLFIIPLFLLTSSVSTPPGSLKKDVKTVCKCFKEFIKLEKKGFPKTSPYYQEARKNAETSIVQVEKSIQTGTYSGEQFNAMIKKKCPELIKLISELNSNSEQN